MSWARLSSVPFMRIASTVAVTSRGGRVAPSPLSLLRRGNPRQAMHVKMQRVPAEGTDAIKQLALG